MRKLGSIFLLSLWFILIWTSLEADELRKLLRVLVVNESQQRDILSQPFDFAQCQQPLQGNHIDIVASIEEEQKLLSMGYQPIVLIPDLQVEYEERIGHLRDMGIYHTLQEMIDELHDIHEAYPEITQLQIIGQSYEGRDIWAIKVSDNAQVEEDEPEILYLANLHAREVITPEILFHFLNHLVDHYGSDETVTEIVDTRQIWMIPTTNPDGHVYIENENPWWRKNRRLNDNGTYGVDLNRNFGYRWGYDHIGSSPYSSSNTYRGTAPFSEPETQVIRDFVCDHHFVVALSYHSYGNMWLYPWGYIPENTHHHAIFDTLATTAVQYNGYEAGNAANGVIYTTNGDTDDWAYGETEEKYRFFSFTPEVGHESDGFWPSESRVPYLVEENLQPNLYYAQIAGQMPYHLAPPQAPRINPMTIDDDGTYQVSWQPVVDIHNPITAYALKEYADYQIIVDGAETNEHYQLDHGFILRMNRHHSGDHSFYGGRRDELSSTCTAKKPLLITEDMHTLQFWTWYEIESNRDYAYVEVSTDDGDYWQSIPGSITTESNPYGENLGHGITGTSNDWIHAAFDLSEFMDQSIKIRFRYLTNRSRLEEGIYIDDIHPTTLFESEQVLVEEISQPHYLIHHQDEGLYFYSVRAVDDDGDWGPWSQLEPIYVEYLTNVSEHISVSKQPILYQNNPNPFNPYTTISYQLPQTTPATLSIYDVSGHLIRRWQFTDQISGEVRWDGRDLRGEIVSSGIYFYQLKTSEWEMTKIAVLMK